MRKATVIIFTEYDKLKEENPLLKEKIKYLQEINYICEFSDSLHVEEIKLYKEDLNLKDKKIKKLKNSNKSTIVGGVILFIIGLLL